METSLPLILQFIIVMTLILKDLPESKINTIANFFKKILPLLLKKGK